MNTLQNVTEIKVLDVISMSLLKGGAIDLVTEIPDTSAIPATNSAGGTGGEGEEIPEDPLPDPNAAVGGN